LCAFWFGRLKIAGRPPFFRRPERRRSLPFARDADAFGACDGIVGQLNKLQTIENKRNIAAFERGLDFFLEIPAPISVYDTGK